MDDLKILQAILNKLESLESINNEVNKKIDGMAVEIQGIKTEIQDVKEELTTEIQEVKAELATGIQEVKAKLDENQRVFTKEVSYIVDTIGKIVDQNLIKL